MLRLLYYFALANVICVLLIRDTVSASSIDKDKELQVAVSIKPLHSLVAGVMLGVGKPYLIIRSNASPHNYQLKPSDAQVLQKADLIFWIGPYFENFLIKPISTISKDSVTIALADINRLVLHKNRASSFQLSGDDHHTHDSHQHSHGNEDEAITTDMHIWLDPVNAGLMVSKIVKSLSVADPKNRSTYEKNGKTMKKRLDQLISELEKRLESYRDQPIIVFHDAYQYLEKRFKLSQVDSVLIDPDRRPGARTIRLLHKKVRERRPVCAFYEPQFDPTMLKALMKGANVQFSILDPIGSAIAPGPDLYFKLMETNIDALADCLSGAR